MDRDDPPRIGLGMTLATAAALSFGVVLAFDAVWGSRNCSIEYCGPAEAMLVYPLVLAASVALLIRRRSQMPQRPGVVALLSGRDRPSAWGCTSFSACTRVNGNRTSRATRHTYTRSCSLGGSSSAGS
jgi:hypothetical protein